MEIDIPNMQILGKTKEGYVVNATIALTFEEWDTYWKAHREEAKKETPQ